MTAGERLDPGDLARAREALSSASRLLVLTGAGMSAESGVPTFRGPEGLWKRRRPEELATPAAFRRDPCLVWEWYAWRRERVSACVPHRGHEVLATRQRTDPASRLVTQNVDGLHLRALEALSPEVPDHARPLELHGSLFRTRCTGCGRVEAHRGPVDATGPHTLPRCGCGALLRPDVVWFGEALDPDVLETAFEAAAAADVCLVVGTSALVHPAASLPSVTRRGGGRLIEVNPEPTPLSGLADVTLRGGAGRVLPLLVD